jgi:hypothetical protein
MLTFAVEAKFGQGYIADPYWPEVAQLIDIQKKSGINRAKSDANRRKALEGYLTANDMTLDDYEQLEKKAKKPFHTNGSDEIIIPELHVTSCLVAICHQARSAMRPCDPNQVRSRFICTHWDTGKTKADGLWERFVKVTSGTGQTLSNQRGLRKNAYIKQFTARGQITIDEDYIDAKTLNRALEWGGRFVGIGASRKMGWGRFELSGFAEV